MPGKQDTVRGFSGVRLLVVDEAARILGDLYLSNCPRLAVSEGRLLALSTPFGARGWWYEAWTSEEDWERYQVPAEECPRISEAFLAEERRSMGEWWFEQEYGCKFPDFASFLSSSITVIGAGATRGTIPQNLALCQPQGTWHLFAFSDTLPESLGDQRPRFRL